MRIAVRRLSLCLYLSSAVCYGSGMSSMKRKLIPGTDLEVSPICYGTATFGADVQGAELDTLIGAFRVDARLEPVNAAINHYQCCHCFHSDVLCNRIYSAGVKTGTVAAIAFG